MLSDLEKTIQNELDKDFPGVSKLRADFTPKATTPSAAASVAEQLLGVAEAIKMIHREIDLLETDMVKRFEDLRRRLGSKG